VRIDGQRPPLEILDHVCRLGDPPCPVRQPSGRCFRKGPADMARQCRTCRFVRHCLAGEYDAERIPLDLNPENSL
jgi:hypothetical protein